MAHLITVYPMKRSALLIHHPEGGQVVQAGSQWPNDGFTARMLSDRQVTANASEGYSGAPHPLEGKMKQRIAVASAAKQKKK